MEQLIVRDPYSGEELQRLSWASNENAAKALASTAAAFEKWRRSSSFERARLLEAVADALEFRQAEFADLIRSEAGKPITYAKAEVTRALGVLRWAAAEALRYSGELLRLDASANGRPGFGIHQKFARGPVLGITPFNFPLNLVAHKVAPAIACGCSILIKPSPYTPLTAIRFAELFREALPELPGLVQAIVAGDDLADQMTRAREVKTISFTGSARVGWMIRKQAPEKPALLELGGNAWVLVMEDTPEELLPRIAKRIAGAAFGYSGQSCISVQNVAVAAPALPRFRECLEEATRAAPFGDPADPQVISGPLVHADAASRVLRVLDSLPDEFSRISSTARIGAGSSPSILSPLLLIAPSGTLSGPLPSVMQEEIFGPVMSLTAFTSIGEAVAAINSSRYGLQAGVFTQNFSAIEKLYQELEVGGVVVNDVPTTRYDHQPYGGMKDSGAGREGIRYAMDELCESKFLALSSLAPL